MKGRPGRAGEYKGVKGACWKGRGVWRERDVRRGRGAGEWGA